MNNNEVKIQQYYQFIALCQEHEQTVYKVIEQKGQYEGKYIIVEGELDKLDGSQQLVIDSDYWIGQGQEFADLTATLVMYGLAIWNAGIVKKYNSSIGKFEGKGNFISLKNADSEAPDYLIHFNGTTETFKRCGIFLDVAVYFGNPIPNEILDTKPQQNMPTKSFSFDEQQKTVANYFCKLATEHCDKDTPTCESVLRVINGSGDYIFELKVTKYYDDDKDDRFIDFITEPSNITARITKHIIETVEDIDAFVLEDVDGVPF